MPGATWSIKLFPIISENNWLIMRDIADRNHMKRSYLYLSDRGMKKVAKLL